MVRQYAPVTPAGGLDAVDRALQRHDVLVTGTAALACILLAVQALPGVNSSYLLITATLCVLGGVVARTEWPEYWRTSLSLFVWAMLVRVLVAATCYGLGLREGGPFLGPDSTTYYRMSGDLAASALRLGVHPVTHFGSYDVAHYYLFAAAIRYFQADLFGLQVLNCALAALAAPLMFGVARVVLPSAASVIGAVVALHPSLIMLSAVDLLKDSSIVFGTALVIWVLVRLTRETNRSAMVLYFLAGVMGALYLRTGRFYTFAYLEAAFIVTVAILALVRTSVFQRRVALALAFGLFAVAEAVPARMSWPPSPVMVGSMVSYALGAPGLSHYALGFFDYVQLGDEQGSSSAEQASRPVVAGPATSLLSGAIASSANLFRRLYGPFVWILPSDWRFRSLQAGDYLLYPGMLVWYGLIPFFSVGIVSTAWRLVTRTEGRFGVIFLWFFTVVYFGQYLTINLSYRQRDVMLPVLLVFAFIGGAWVMRHRNWQRYYIGYWVALVLLAQMHLLARALLV